MSLRLARTTALCALAHGLLGLSASAQPAPSGEPIVVGQRFELRSEHMSETRAFLVHLPPDYDGSGARYPVLLVLDGEEHFEHVSSTADLLSSAGKIPALLVVGVENTDRYRDMDSTVGPGASPFLKFITDELVPRIDREYRTHPYRMLVGHSGAGLFALYSLIDAPETFRSFIVIAPAFGDHRELPQIVDAFIRAHEQPDLKADVFLAADESPGMQLTGAWELSSYLNDRATRMRDLRFTFRRYPESHSTVPLLGVYEGLQSIFDGWSLDIDDAFALYEKGGLAAIEKHFDALSTRLGFPVEVPQEALLAPFYELEGSKRFAEAEPVIERVIESFPDDPTPLYYAGRLYMQMGDRARAIETLQQSLRLSPDYGPSRGLLEYMNADRDD